MQDSQIVKVKLRMQLAALLIHGVVARLLIDFARAVAGPVEAAVAVLPVGARLVILVELEEQLDGLVVFALLQGQLGSQVSQKALRLLTCWLAQPIFELCRVLRHARAVLVGLLEALLRRLAVLLQQLEQGFEGVQQHLILLNVDVLGRDGVLAQVGAQQDAIGVLAHNVLFDALHARHAPLLLPLGLFLGGVF